MPKTKTAPKSRKTPRATRTIELTQERRDAALAGQTLESKLKIWEEWDKVRAVPRDIANPAIDKLIKQIRKLAAEVPSGAWLAQLYKPAAWPPGGYSKSPAVQAMIDTGLTITMPPAGRLMPRAKGERRLYPPGYLTSSGHSYDVYCQRWFLGATQWLSTTVAGCMTSVRFGQKRVQETLTGEIMLHLGIFPTPLEDFIGRGEDQIDASMDRVERALQELSREFGVRYLDNSAWVPQDRWPAFNAAAIAYDQRPRELLGDRIDVAADGYMGAIHHMSDLCPEIKRLVLRGVGFQIHRRK